MNAELIGHNGGPTIDETPWGRDGYVKIARASREHPLVGFGKTVSPADPERGFCYSRAEAWQDLIMECRYTPGEVVNKGKRMEIKPGQLLGAISWLANRWNWTPKTVRWFLDQLQADEMIERSEPENGGSRTKTMISPDDNHPHLDRGKRNGKRNGNQIGVLTICNYEIYQMVMHAQRQATGQLEGQANGKPTASARQANGNTLIKEEGKKIEVRVNQQTQQQEAAREAAAPAIDASRPYTIDGAALCKRLTEVCGPALDDPVNCFGLITGAVPIMWLREGCDLELDVVETLRAMAVKHKGKRIRAWEYFSAAVFEARDRRLRGGPRPIAKPAAVPIDRSVHWLENTEPGRAKVREIGRDEAAKYFAANLANQTLTPDGYTVAEIERRDEEAYKRRMQAGAWSRAR